MKVEAILIRKASSKKWDDDAMKHTRCASL